jgi:protein disulfide-isomerase A6
MKGNYWFFVISCLIFQVQQAKALYTSSSAVTLLTQSNFEEFVFSTEHAVAVEFFAPWCGHCKNFAPEYEKAASMLKGLARVGAVDCQDTINQPLCAKYEIKGFPTVKLFVRTGSGNKQDIGKLIYKERSRDFKNLSNSL